MVERHRRGLAMMRIHRNIFIQYRKDLSIKILEKFAKTQKKLYLN